MHSRPCPQSAALLTLSFLFRLSLSFALFSALSSAQMRHTAAASDLNHHIFVIAPLQGKGTPADPIRPMFVPVQGFRPGVATSGASGIISRTGILGYHTQISDDGKFALVEFVAATRTDFKDILATTDSRVQIFEKGVHQKNQIEAAFKVFRKDFSFDHFQMAGAH